MDKIMDKYCVVFLVALFLIFVFSGYVCGLSVNQRDFIADVLFDKPKNSVDYFSTGYNAEIFNDNSVPVVLNATSSGNCSGIKASINSVVIPNNTASNISVFLDVPSSLSEGVYSCDVKFFTKNTGEEVYSKSTVRVKWPDPALSVSWNSDLGKLKAGETYKRQITVSETMGYKSALSSSIEISHMVYEGPAIINKQFYFLGEIKPFEKKTIDIEISIPSKNLTPGNYTLQTVPFARNNKPEENIGYYVNYEIPPPVMKVSGNLNFDAITFIPGKDTGLKTIEIQETGGFTPIEELNMTLVYGEQGWITYEPVDYVPPGGLLNYTFKINIPENAEIGKREWKFLLKTKYAGFREIDASVLVYFPKIDEAIAELNEMEKNDIVNNLIKIMEITKQKTGREDVLDIMGAIYIYSASYSLINEISIVRKNPNENEKLSAISVIKRDIDRIKIAKGVLKDENIKTYTDKIIESSENIWNQEISAVIDTIEKNLAEYETKDYKLCAIGYKKISEIYGGYEEKQKKCEEKYKKAIEDAANINSEIEEISSEINKNTAKIGTRTIVLNPFSYDSVIELYEKQIKNYNTIITLYNNSGEKNEAILYDEKYSALKEEKNFIIFSFMIYGTIILIILIIIITRVVIGITTYGKDEKEKGLGNVVMG